MNNLVIPNSPTSRYVVPQFTERTSYGMKTVDPYGKLFEERIIFLGAPIDDTSANDVMSQLLVLEAQDSSSDITLYINSGGGSMTALAAIYDTIQYIKSDVQTVCLGQAASAAAVLLAAGTPGKRLALPNARIMIHQPATGDSGRGQASDIEIQALEILRMRTWLEDALAYHTGKPAKEIAHDIERDKFLTAQQALEYGIIDQVLSPPKGLGSKAQPVLRTSDEVQSLVLESKED